ncbi:purine and uridine phosphorylase, partial [Aspergillus campestris IBT 28561]
MREDAQRGFTHEDYTVGWICPLEVELIAALEMLDEEHEGLPQPPSDHNVYNLGSIAGKNVVIAGLWKPGNNAAATVVTQMRMTFPHVRFGLLVGIGGGVPGTTEQGEMPEEGRIHLGDVVVSKPTGIHSGVIQYDHGKAYNGQFERTGALAPPPPVLLQAAQVLAAKRARWRRDPLAENIMRIDTTAPKMSRFRYPGADKDHLYPPEYVHRVRGVSCRQCECDTDQRIIDSLAEEADKDALPLIVVHRGTIASGELVIKDGVVRDRLAQEHGILCFEMEAAGALADFPCLAIRGVSDYCDSHKNDDWHGYAAAAAAAYARELLSHLPIDQVTRLAYVPNLEKLVNFVDDHERQDILEFISTRDEGAVQADTLKQRHKGSGRYLLETEQFRSWVDGSQILFCPGLPGAGKTVMTSIVVDHLQQQFLDTPAVGIAYFFCNFSQQSIITEDTFMACLLKQLVQSMPQIPGAIREYFARYRENKRRRPQLDDIYQWVNLVASQLSRIYIMIDALDECEAEVRTSILSQIFDLQSNCRLSLFATSRLVPDITSQFEQYPWLEIRAHPDDVKSYLSGQIAKLRPFVRKDANLRELIIESIAKAIDGMFLLAKLSIDSLKNKPSVKSIKSALKGLPTGSSAYNQAYQATMERINSQDSQTFAKKVLSWLVCSKERLTLSQLQHALGVEIGSSAFDEENLPDIECLISACA